MRKNEIQSIYWIAQIFNLYNNLKHIKIMKRIIAYIVLSSIVLLSSCKKETLDFTSDKYFDVEQFLKSSNCDTDCQKAASCEGKIVKLRGKVNLDNAVKEQGEFWLNDVENEKYQINVKLDPSIVDIVFYKLDDFKDEVVRVEGEIEGFDAPTNVSCDRKFILKIDDEKKVTSE